MRTLIAFAERRLVSIEEGIYLYACPNERLKTYFSSMQAKFGKKLMFSSKHQQRGDLSLTSKEQLSRQERQWRITKAPQFSPQVFLQNLALFSAVLLVGCVGFYLMESPRPALLCLGQIIITGILCTRFAIHAADGEKVALYSDRIIVNSYRGLDVREYQFPIELARIESGTGADTGKYWMQGAGRKAMIGSRLDPMSRCLVIGEIAIAMRAARAKHSNSCSSFFAL